MKYTDRQRKNMFDDYIREMKRSIRNRWSHIHERCENPNRKDYKYYGAKGIRVSDDWGGFNGFYAWFIKSYNEYCAYHGMTRMKDVAVDRIDSKKGYSKANCHIISQRENLIKSNKERKGTKYRTKGIK